MTKKADQILVRAKENPERISEEEKSHVAGTIKKVSTFTLWTDIISFIAVNGSIFLVKVFKQTIPADVNKNAVVEMEKQISVFKY